MPLDSSTELDLDRLRASQENKRLLVTIVVTGCAYSCCGKGWQRKDGYEQTYTGYVDNLKEPDGFNVGTFMLYSAGIGTLSYVVAARFDELADVAFA